MVRHVDTLVVGAGPAGLAVGACLRHASVPFLILEAGEHVGMSWRARYDRLHLHTVKQYSALPWMPFPPGASRYPSRQEVIAYLEVYAERFDLHPSLLQPVTSARHQGGQWSVHTPAGDYLSRNLIVCTGFNRQPIVPTWGGEESFGGRIVHSAEYRRAVP